jgi:hypothetical protein
LRPKQRSPIERAPLRKPKVIAKLSAGLKRAKTAAEKQKQHNKELRAALLELRARLTKAMKSLAPK